MKRPFALLCVLITLAFPAMAEVYLEVEPPADWQTRPLMRLRIFRTAQSDAMLLECGGEAMMIDGGLSRFTKEIDQVLRTQAIKGFKYFFSTHPHHDHIDGLNNLLRGAWKVETILTPFAVDEREERLQTMVQLAAKQGVPVVTTRNGDMLRLGSATLKVLQLEEASSDINARSGALLVRYGNARVLLTADITRSTQSFLAQRYGDDLKADILKAPHHGIVKVEQSFWDKVNPALVCVTNIYKKNETASQAGKAGTPVLFSGVGAIILETDGTDWYVHQLSHTN